MFSVSSDSAQIRTSEIDSLNAVQAGPILILDGKPRTLSIKNDENERRIVVAKTNDDKVLFLAIYKKDSAYIGPKLSEVPNLLQEFTQETDIEISSALNLDGGTASAFYTEGVSLGELTKIGSYFCVSE